MVDQATPDPEGKPTPKCPACAPNPVASRWPDRGRSHPPTPLAPALVSVLGCLSLVASLTALSASSPAPPGAAQANPDLTTRLRARLRPRHRPFHVGGGRRRLRHRPERGQGLPHRPRGHRLEGLPDELWHQCHCRQDGHRADDGQPGRASSTTVDDLNFGASLTPATPTGKTASSRPRAPSAGSRAASPTSS